MGSTCWDWREESRILHFSCLPWKNGTYPTNAYHDPSSPSFLSCGGCCLGNTPQFPQQMLPKRTGHSPCHWTVVFKNTRQSFNPLENHQKRSKDGKMLVEKIKCITHRAPVWTGPKPLIASYSLKYWGIDKPKKIENPSMNFVRKLLRLQNWRKLKPTEPVPKYDNRCD